MMNKLLSSFLLLVIVMGLVILLSGCFTKEPAVTPDEKAGIGESVEKPGPNPSEEGKEPYITEIDLLKTGLGIDSVDENILVAPRGKKVAFVGTKMIDEKGQPLTEPVSQLVVADLVTGKVKTLDKGWFMRILQWSSDGKYILYMSDADVLKVANLDGVEPVTIGIHSYSGAISPDNTKVAYTKRDLGIFVCDIQGGNEQQGTRKKGDWSPIWYPDGKTLFYFADRDKTLGDGAGQLQGLAKVNIETGKQENIISGETGKYRRAKWIVPGKSVYIEKGWDDGFYEMMVDLEKGKITDFGESPMGMMRAVVDKAKGLLYLADKGKVQVFDATGKQTNSFELKKSVEEGKNLDYYGLAVSPEGTRIAYLYGDMGFSSEPSQVKGRKVWLIDSEGHKGIELTDKYGLYRSPQWTPDGEALVLLEGNGEPAKAEGELMIKVFKAQ